MYRKFDEVGYPSYPPVWYCYFCTRGVVELRSRYGPVRKKKKNISRDRKKEKNTLSNLSDVNIMCSAIIREISTYKYYTQNRR